MEVTHAGPAMDNPLAEVFSNRWYTVFDRVQYGPFPNVATATRFIQHIMDEANDSTKFAFTWGVNE